MQPLRATMQRLHAPAPRLRRLSTAAAPPRRTVFCLNRRATKTEPQNAPEEAQDHELPDARILDGLLHRCGAAGAQRSGCGGVWGLIGALGRKHRRRSAFGSRANVKSELPMPVPYRNLGRNSSAALGPSRGKDAMTGGDGHAEPPSFDGGHRPPCRTANAHPGEGRDMQGLGALDRR